MCPHIRIVIIYNVFNSTKHKHTLTDGYKVPWLSREEMDPTTTCYMNTKDHIAMHTLLF